MIWEILCGFFIGGTALNGIAVVLMYRQYLSLGAFAMEYAALVIESMEEQEDGTIAIDPLALAGISMDHISQLSGLLKWIRF
ncbi:MAG TPA: hypothetical protein VN372_03395 [Methanospirillum sp.]|nr:hypothetical protein [Methanospirillum sp.]